jgi:hypothetical protein
LASKLIGIGCPTSDVLDVALTKVNVHFFIFLKIKYTFDCISFETLGAAVLISFVRECTHLHADREDPVDVSGDRRKMTMAGPHRSRNGHTRANQQRIPSVRALVRDERGPDIKAEATAMRFNFTPATGFFSSA